LLGEGPLSKLKEPQLYVPDAPCISARLCIAFSQAEPLPKRVFDLLVGVLRGRGVCRRLRLSGCWTAGVIMGDGAGVGVMGLGVGSTGGRGTVLEPYCPRSEGRYVEGSG